MRPSELLLNCLWVDPGHSHWRPITEPVWEEIARAAIRHGLAPLLYHRVQFLDPGLAPPPRIVKHLRDLYVHNELRNTTAYAELARVLCTLQDAGVEVIVLKGAFLAEAVYGDPALRPMHDVDLLVRAQELDRVQHLLAALGYQPCETGWQPGKHHLPPFIKQGTLPIEVHWTTVPTSSAVSADLHHLWRTAQPAGVAGVHVLTLSPEHLLHHLCLHASYHHRFRIPLLQLHDVAVVVRHYRNLDWDAFAEIVHTHASQQFVYPVLGIVNRVFAAGVPSAQLERFRESDADDAGLDTAWEFLLGPTQRKFPRLFVRLAEINGSWHRVRHLARHVLRLPEHFRSKHGLAENSLWAYWYSLAHAGSFLRDQALLTAELLLFSATRGSLAAASRRAELERWADRYGTEFFQEEPVPKRRAD